MSLISPMRIMGIKVDFHWSILILIFLITRNLAPYLMAKHNSGMIAVGAACVFLSAAFIASILIHELGHVWAGRKFGIDFHGITIFVLGGAARMTGQPKTPKAECLMAIAGPACSIALAVVSFLLALVFGALGFELVGHSFAILATINGMLGVFNMIPAFPLDGGRVARAAIWKFTGSFAVATRYSTYGGMALGSVLVVMGVVTALGYQTFFGQGIGDGLWIGIIGAIVVLLAKLERKNVLKMGYRP